MLPDHIIELLEKKLSEPLAIFNWVMSRVHEVYDETNLVHIKVKGKIDINGASELRDVLAHLRRIIILDPTADDYEYKAKVEIELMYEHIRRGTVETVQNCVKNFHANNLKIMENYVRKPSNFESLNDLNKFSKMMEYCYLIQEALTEARRKKAHSKEWKKSIKLFFQALNLCKIEQMNIDDFLAIKKIKLPK